VPLFCNRGSENQESRKTPQFPRSGEAERRRMSNVFFFFSFVFFLGLPFFFLLPLVVFFGGVSWVGCWSLSIPSLFYFFLVLFPLLLSLSFLYEVDFEMSAPFFSSAASVAAGAPCAFCSSGQPSKPCPLNGPLLFSRPFLWVTSTWKSLPQPFLFITFFFVHLWECERDMFRG